MTIKEIINFAHDLGYAVSFKDERFIVHEKRAFNHTERNSSDRLRMRNNI